MEQYTQRLDIRQGAGAVGIFTQGIVSRQTMFEHIVALLVGQYLFTLAQR
ncbi:inosine/xanthosine triphosphatase OS=Lysinibacillus sphaericus OX=1421 GN=yjjX PE=4 SV=1 [Lysinibacillus sphaericus]